MGISSASEIFTERIRVMLEGIPGQLNIGKMLTRYVLIYGKSDKKHHDSLMVVLQRLEDNGFTVNVEKCEFYKTELTFFGLRISSKGVSPTDDRVKALKDTAAPVDVKDLRSFLCTVLYSARFMKGVCSIAAPLWTFTSDGAPWKWGEVEQKAFEGLKEAISTRCTAYFNTEWRTEMTVDASPVGLGAVLSQINPKDEKDRDFVCFASRLLTDVERRYSQCEKEALATGWSSEHFWLYLIGKPFKLVTDNRAVQLIFVNTVARPPARNERLALRLSQFDYEIVYKTGLMKMADYYSRHPGKTCTAEFLAESMAAEQYINHVTRLGVPNALTMSEVALATKDDAELQELIKHIMCSNHAQCQKSLMAFKEFMHEMSVTRDGILLRERLVVLPEALREQVVRLAHSGHQGIVKAKALIRSRVWYPGIDKQVERTVRTCRECQANTDRQSFEPLKPSELQQGHGRWKTETSSGR